MVCTTLYFWKAIPDPEVLHVTYQDGCSSGNRSVRLYGCYSATVLTIHGSYLGDNVDLQLRSSGYADSANCTFVRGTQALIECKLEFLPSAVGFEWSLCIAVGGQVSAANVFLSFAAEEENSTTPAFVIGSCHVQSPPCYMHGVCQLDGNCTCHHPWTGILVRKSMGCSLSGNGKVQVRKHLALSHFVTVVVKWYYEKLFLAFLVLRLAL